jgi:hypothetical protein
MTPTRRDHNLDNTGQQTILGGENKQRTGSRARLKLAGSGCECTPVQ